MHCGCLLSLPLTLLNLNKVFSTGEKKIIITITSTIITSHALVFITVYILVTFITILIESLFDVCWSVDNANRVNSMFLSIMTSAIGSRSNWTEDVIIMPPCAAKDLQGPQRPMVWTLPNSLHVHGSFPCKYRLILQAFNKCFGEVY